MSNIQRFSAYDEGLGRDDLGEWVTYDDHCDAISALETQISDLKWRLMQIEEGYVQAVGYEFWED